MHRKTEQFLEQVYFISCAETTQERKHKAFVGTRLKYNGKRGVCSFLARFNKTILLGLLLSNN